jgi:hypothetical protein
LNRLSTRRLAALAVSIADAGWQRLHARSGERIDVLQRSNLEYDQLLDLLHCRFVNSGPIRIVGAECDTDGMTLQSLSDAALGRMHRLLRLWRNPVGRCSPSTRHLSR